MIEKRFLPVTFLVTVGAQGPQAAFVFVVLFVACKAVRWRIAELDLRLVAIAARNFFARMPAFEREVGELVVEGLFVQGRDVHRAPLMIRMAGTAFLLPHATVITLFLDSILGDILVAVQAQGILRGFLETRVAALAVGFDVRMAFNDLARHEHALEGFGARGRWQADERKADREPCDEGS